MIERRVLPQSPSQWAKNVGLALALGGTIGFVLWLQDQTGQLLLTVAISAWIGLCIYLTCIIALAFLCRFLDFEARFKLWLPLGLIFFVSSGVGFFVGAHSVEWLTFGSLRVATLRWSDGFAFAGVLGLISGALWFTYERMKSQIEESTARLKDQELAEQELETARKIQRRILPPPTLEGEGFRLAARNLPARVVAGDFYDVLPRADGALGLIVADVVGKGIGASLIMAGVKAQLGYIASGRSVPETMEELNRVLLEELGAREFVALCYACYEPATGRFELANAGLPDPYVLKRGAAPQAIVAEGPRLPLGVRGHLGYRSVKGHLEEGDALLLFTDGIPESLTPTGEPLGYEDLESLLVDGAATTGPSDRLDALVRRLEAATTTSRDDDWTLVLVERDVPASGAATQEPI